MLIGSPPAHWIGTCPLDLVGPLPEPKWVVFHSIEFVADFRERGPAMGGYNDDHEYYGYRMPI